jgi:hypothetical protein
MATTTPDNIWTPDSGDDYALTVDLAAMADTIQDALINRAIDTTTIDYVATVAARTALVSQWTTDGHPVSSSNPMYVHRADADTGRKLEGSVDGITFYPIPQAGVGGTPYLMAAGSVTVTLTASPTGSATITLPASRFGFAPIITATPSNSAFACAITAVSTSSATVALRHIDGSSVSSNYTVYWTAVQMTSAAAAG